MLRAVEAIRQGQLVVFPTETVYGLGAGVESTIVSFPGGQPVILRPGGTGLLSFGPPPQPIYRTMPMEVHVEVIQGTVNKIHGY